MTDLFFKFAEWCPGTLTGARERFGVFFYRGLRWAKQVPRSCLHGCAHFEQDRVSRGEEKLKVKSELKKENNSGTYGDLTLRQSLWMKQFLQDQSVKSPLWDWQQRELFSVDANAECARLQRWRAHRFGFSWCSALMRESTLLGAKWDFAFGTFIKKSL